MATNDLKLGKFYEVLKRNNKQIRDDRAEVIVETAQTTYKRRIEDLEIDQKRDERDLNSMLDLSPTSALNLIVAERFDSTAFVNRRAEMIVAMRNRAITIEMLKDDFNILFNEQNEG